MECDLILILFASKDLYIISNKAIGTLDVFQSVFKCFGFLSKDFTMFVQVICLQRQFQEVVLNSVWVKLSTVYENTPIFKPMF